MITQNANITLIIITTILLLIILNKINKKIKQTQQTTIKKLTKLNYPILTIIITLIIQIIIITSLKEQITNQTNTTKIIITLIITLITYALSILSATILRQWQQNTKKQQNLTQLIQNTQNISLTIIATTTILNTWIVNTNTTLIILTIITIATLIALKDTLKNITAGINISIENTIKKGDLIELEDGERGYVTNMSPRYITIKNFDFEEVHIPNTKIANTKIKNYAQPTNTHRIKLTLPIAVGENLNKIEQLILQLIDEHENILKYPLPRIYATKITTQTIELEITFFIHDYHDLTIIQSEITKELYNLITKNKIKTTNLKTTTTK